MRVLDALENQDFNNTEWEWIVVDNASTNPVKEMIPSYLSERIQVVEEKKPGLTAARICGIQQAKFDWIVFIDDDNVLSLQYLLNAKHIIESHSTIGAFGGRLLPEYEMEPDPVVVPHLFMLAIRNPTSDCVGLRYDWEVTPFGAGMVVRKELAVQYAALTVSDAMRYGLDRKEGSLMSSGDVDMAHLAVDKGYTIGVFTALSLVHVIPAVRVSTSYLFNMMRYNTLSNHLLFYIRFKRLPSKPNRMRRIKQHLRFWKRGAWFESAMLRARDWGTYEAIKRIKQL
jgi:glycosyltransferase involved in cell wall biosynthesis